VETAKELGVYDVKLLSVVAGSSTTAVCTVSGELFTFGAGDRGKLGHGGEEHELVPRLVEAVVVKKVVGVSIDDHTAVWTEMGELFTFGGGYHGKLGHGGTQEEHVPRLVEALVGKKVIGAAAGYSHTAVWTEEGELLTFGQGEYGRLGQGGNQPESVPRLVAIQALK